MEANTSSTTESTPNPVNKYILQVVSDLNNDKTEVETEAAGDPRFDELDVLMDDLEKIDVDTFNTTQS